jgi:hypothetical protein
MRQPMLLKDVLTQALGFVGVALTQLIRVETVIGFLLEGAAHRDPFIA